MWYLSILKKSADSIRWAFGNPRLAIELSLVIGLLFIGWRYNKTVQKLEDVSAERGYLEEGLKQKITIANGQIQILKRQKDGKVVVKRVYVPPEGSVVIKQTDWNKLNGEYSDLSDKLRSSTSPEERKELEERLKRLMDKMSAAQDDIDDGEMVIKDMGFTLRPGFGLEWAGVGLSPRLDMKFFFYKRYSAVIGGGKDGLDVAASRHIDDIVFGRPQNVEIFAGYKFLRFNGGEMYVIGFRSNF